MLVINLSAQLRKSILNISCAFLLSQFYNSNWCMYGVETVGVFAVCVVCAFLMGMGAGSVINSAYQ